MSDITTTQQASDYLHEIGYAVKDLSAFDLKCERCSKRATYSVSYEERDSYSAPEVDYLCDEHLLDTARDYDRGGDMDEWEIDAAMAEREHEMNCERALHGDY